VQDKEFVELINNALGYLTPTELANGLSVSIPTIRRWAKGTSMPIKIARKAVKKYIEERLSED